MLVDLVRDTSKAMPAAGTPTAVTALRVWHCGYRSLGELSQYVSLTTLVVATYPDADLEPIAALERLEYLSLLHLPHAGDLAPSVASLRPLADLPQLEHLELFARISKYPKSEIRRFYEQTGVSDAFAPAPGVSDGQ